MNRCKKLKFATCLFLLVSLISTSLAAYASGNDTIRLSDIFGEYNYDVKFTKHGVNGYVQFNNRQTFFINRIAKMDFVKNGRSKTRDINPLYTVEFSNEVESIAIYVEEGLSAFIRNGVRYDINGNVNRELMGIINFYYEYLLPDYESMDKITVERDNVSVPPDNDWAFQEINQAIDNKLIPTTMQNKYDAYLTRDEMCLLALSWFDRTLTSVSTSVKSIDSLLEKKDGVVTDTFEIATITCYDLGLIEKTGDSLLEPYKNITRLEALKILIKAATITTEMVVRLDQREPYNDQASFDDADAEDVKWAYGAEMMIGYPDNYFKPDDFITRKQAYVIMQRMYRCLKWPLYSVKGFPAQYDFRFQIQINGLAGYMGEVVPAGIIDIFIISGGDIKKVTDAISVVNMTLKGREDEELAFIIKPHPSNRSFIVAMQLNEPFINGENRIAYITLTDGVSEETYWMCAMTSNET